MSPNYTAIPGVVTTGDTAVQTGPAEPTTDYTHVTTGGGGTTLTTSSIVNTTTEFIFSTLVKPSTRNVTENPVSWSVDELKILGGVLWVVIFITLVGNFACFYAVIKNFKQILQHPFFQSNVFCVYLSIVDIVQIVLVGIPAAICFTSDNPALRSGIYNRAIVDHTLDFVVWLQLLLVVAICMDRAGHICRPFHYHHTIKAYKTVFAIVMCTAIPFLTLTVPYIVALRSAMNYFKMRSDPNEAFACEIARAYNESGEPIPGVKIFMGCTLQLSEDIWPGSNAYQMWENVSFPLIMFLAVAALVGANGIIVYKLIESGRLQRDNVQRQDEVARSIRLTCTVSFCQAILIMASTLPLRWYQIDHRLNSRCTPTADNDCSYSIHKYTSYYTVTARVLVFLGPMFNPWLYPIRMASIRSFLVTKKKTVVSSVNTSLLRLKSRYYTQSSSNDINNNLVQTQLLPENYNNTVQTQLVPEYSVQAPSHTVTTGI